MRRNSQREAPSPSGFEVYIPIRRSPLDPSVVEISRSIVYCSDFRRQIVQERFLYTRSWNNRDAGALYALTHTLKRLERDYPVVVYSNSKKVVEVFRYGGIKHMPNSIGDRKYILDLLKTLKGRKVELVVSRGMKVLGRFLHSLGGQEALFE